MAEAEHVHRLEHVAELGVSTVCEPTPNGLLVEDVGLAVPLKVDKNVEEDQLMRRVLPLGPVSEFDGLGRLHSCYHAPKAVKVAIYGDVIRFGDQLLALVVELAGSHDVGIQSQGRNGPHLLKKLEEFFGSLAIVCLASIVALQSEHMFEMRFELAWICADHVDRHEALLL